MKICPIMRYGDVFSDGLSIHESRLFRADLIKWRYWQRVSEITGQRTITRDSFDPVYRFLE